MLISAFILWFNSSPCYKKNAISSSKQFKYRFIRLLLSPVATHLTFLLWLLNDTSSRGITQANQGGGETKAIR